MLWNCEDIQVIADLSLGIINFNRAKIILGVTKKTLKRRIKTYKLFGKDGFIHGNSKKEPVNKIDFAKIFAFIDKYELHNCNFTELSRLLSHYNIITITPSCLRKRFLDLGLLSPKCTKVVKKRLKKHLDKKLEDTGALSIDEGDTLDALRNEELQGSFYFTKSRSKYMGERIEMDACEYSWFIGSSLKYSLHVAIDDATGAVVGLHLDDEETLNGYYHITRQMLEKHGIPVNIRSDKRTVFIYNNKNSKKKKEKNSEDTFTQFAYACKQLGVNLSCCSDPLYKPRVERMNQTIKGILPARLITKGITNIEDANRYLEEEFIPYINNEFARFHFIDNNIKKKVPSAFCNIEKEDIEKTLVVIEQRKINKGHSISYKSSYYKLLDKSGRTIALPPGSSVSIIKTIDDKHLYATDKLNVCFALEKIEERYIYSKDVDPESLKPVKRKKNTYIPDKTHPWSWKKQQEFRAHDKLMKSLGTYYKSPHESVYI